MNKIFKYILIIFFVLMVQNYTYANTLIEDDLVNETLLNKELQKPEECSNFDFEDTDVVEIRLIIKDPIKSEKEVFEGETVNFRTVGNVHYKGKTIIKKHTKVPAKVEVIIKSGMNGIPASIIFGDFEIEGIDKRLLTDMYEVRGQDRSMLVFPLKWALTILPPTGSLTNFIKGGHANLKTNKIIKIQYHPNWLKQDNKTTETTKNTL